MSLAAEWHLSKTHDSEGGTVAYEVLGDGPPLVLVHGTPSWSYLWRTVANELAGRFSVYVYDLLGYGTSEKREGQDVSIAAQTRVLAELLDLWDLREPCIAGHDFGGAITLRLILLEARRFRRVALCNGSGREGSIGPASRGPATGHHGRVPTPVVFAWSAGKDSAFGLWTLLRDPAYEVRALLTTVTDPYERVSMSGVREELLDRQAEAFDLPVLKVRIPAACTNEVYDQVMGSTLASEDFRGVDHVAFSDLFLEDVRAYREERLARAGKHGVFPLWGRDTAQLARDLVAAGFRGIVVCIDPRALDPSFVGRAFDLDFLADLPPAVDPCGENGEFHSFVWDAPMYRAPIACRTREVVVRDGFWYCDVVST
jgi:uncharacterized protein (TIGR00290 family)